MLHRHSLCATVCSVAIAMLAGTLSTAWAQSSRASGRDRPGRSTNSAVTPSFTVSSTTSGSSFAPSSVGILASEGGSGVIAGANSSADPVQPWESQVIGSRSTSGTPGVAADGDSKGSSDGSAGGGPDFVRMMLALLFVLVLIIAVGYIMRRFRLGSGRVSGKGGIEILSRSSINAKQSLCLVRCANRLLVVGVSPNHMAALDRIDDADEIARVVGLAESAGPQSISSTFARLFGREVEEYDTDDTTTQAEQAELYDPKGEQWSEASNELTGLLDKVKGVRRICLRSNDVKKK